MTISNASTPVHPLLAELGFPLPLLPDTGWSWAPIDTPARPLVSVTLTACGDLFLELEDHGEVARYGFNASGELVSLSHTGHFQGKLFAQLKSLALAETRMKLGLSRA